MGGSPPGSGAYGGSCTGASGGPGGTSGGRPGSGGRYGGSIGTLGCSGKPGATASMWYVCGMSRVSIKRVVRRSRGERRVTYALKILALVALAAVTLSAVLQFFGRIAGVTVILVGATFFTYAIYPIVRRLNTRMPLIWAIVVVYAAIGALVAFALAFIVPALANDVQGLAAAAPSFVKNTQQFLTNPRTPVVMHLPAPVRAYLLTLPPQLERYGQLYAGDAASRVLALALSVASLAATLVVIPVISVYLMIEVPDLTNGFVSRLPARIQQRSSAIVHDLDAALGGFIRGQLLVGATIGVCITIALLILHVRYAVLIGVTAGLFDVIPYVGAVVGFVPSVTLALLDSGWHHALLVAIVFVAIFQAEGHFIAPKIVSGSVGLSPLMVIVAILIGGELLGIGGMFLAVPIAAAVRVLVLHTLPLRRVGLPAGARPARELSDTAGVPGEGARPTAPEKAASARV